MKISLKWSIATIVALLLIAGVYRAISSREASRQALQAQEAGQKIQSTVLISPLDVVSVKGTELTQNLEVFGPIKAVNSAFIKARVAGELQDLTVREGDFVKAGQMIARVDSTEYQARLRQAQLQADSAKAQVDIARRSLTNNKALVDQGFISQTALDASLSNLASSMANFQAAQAGADVARKSVDDSVLRSPISGQISQRLAQPGERVAIDAKVVEIVDLSRLELEASVSATDSLSVKVGQPALLTVEGAATPLKANVVRINPSANSASRAVVVYFSVASDQALRQGLFARGVLATGARKAMALPVDCVRTDKPLPYVQVLRDGQVLHQTVTVGTRGTSGNETMVEVSGVAEGAQVLRGAAGALRAGTLVKLSTATS
jgi:RND family efflux transporter MFP subunit